MIIEFTGSTSAGKTTVISEVKRELWKSCVCNKMAYDVILEPLGINMHSSIYKVLLLDAMLLPTIFLGFFRYWNYLKRAVPLIMQRRDDLFVRLNILRNLFKQVAVLDFLKRKECVDCVYIMDEGTIHALQNIFVDYSRPVKQEELIRLLNIIPLPNAIVIVEAPSKEIVRRAMNRLDAPWQLSFSKWTNAAANAMVVNNVISNNERTGPLVFSLCNSASRISSRQEQIRHLRDFILDNATFTSVRGSRS